MLSRFLSWLGLESGAKPGSRIARPPQSRSATSHLYQKKSPSASQGAQKKIPDADFNPYNTGQFDRSASWEKISKTQR